MSFKIKIGFGINTRLTAFKMKRKHHIATMNYRDNVFDCDFIQVTLHHRP